MNHFDSFLLYVNVIQFFFQLQILTKFKFLCDNKNFLNIIYGCALTISTGFMFLKFQ